MKKSALVLLLCLLTSAPVLSQTSQIEPRRDRTFNELSINAFNLLIFGAIDGSYERILSPQTGLSIDVFSIKLNKNEGEDVDLTQAFSKQFSLTTKFKYYLKDSNAAWGFYAEAFAMYSDGFNERDVEFEDQDGGVRLEEVDVEYQDVAIGFGVGNKYVSKGGFVLDISFGLGRNMFNRDSPDMVVLPNVNVGYRF